MSSTDDSHRPQGPASDARSSTRNHWAFIQRAGSGRSHDGSGRTEPDDTIDGQPIPEDVPDWKARSLIDAADKARDVIETINDDHRICSNCFRRFRETAPPGIRTGSIDGEPPDFATGRSWADESQGGTWDVKETMKPADPTNDDWSYEPAGEYHPGIICGNCGHHYHNDTLRPVRAARGESFVKNLSDTIDHLRGEYLSGPSTYDEGQRIDQWEHEKAHLVSAYRSEKQRDTEGTDAHFNEFERALRRLFLIQNLDRRTTRSKRRGG